MMALVLAAACWGFGAVMTKYAWEQIPPLTQLVQQLVVSVVLLWVVIVAALLLSLIPIFGVSAAYLFLGERLRIAEWGSALLILAAVASILWLQRGETVPASDAVTIG